jgi:membrane-bound lytic murein transglycosylase B
MSILRDDLSGRKEALLSQQSEEEQMRQLQALQKRALERTEAEKEDLIKVTKGQEKVYQSTIEAAQRTAGEIRARLFDLRDSGAIPFGTAYEYAKAASAKTGVRPALILAVLRQETNLGENVGQCLLTNSPKKGDGKGKNTGRAIPGVMKPERDVDPFMQITAELGIDPASQVVSCPQSVGYGGAMGPAQFIPSTWMLYKDRLAAATGQNPPSPWNARTAIFATALLMQDNGATADRASERRAALKYFAGGNWSKPAFAFYGDGVMGYADQYQKDIDVLEN